MKNEYQIKEWHLYKLDTPSKQYQLYYTESDGRKRFFAESFDYPVAAALRDALSDIDVRRFAVEHSALPVNELHQHTVDNREIHDRIYHMTDKYNAADHIYPALIARAIATEE